MNRPSETPTGTPAALFHGAGEGAKRAVNMKIKRFTDHWEAFQYCYRMGCQVTVRIRGELWRLYPSGRGEKVKAEAYVPVNHHVGH